jgi:hypothetical protein
MNKVRPATIEEIIQLDDRQPSRREFLTTAGVTAAALYQIGCGDNNRNPISPDIPPVTPPTPGNYVTFTSTATGLVSGSPISGNLTIYGAGEGGGNVVLPSVNGVITATAEHKLRPGNYSSQFSAGPFMRTSPITVGSNGITYSIGDREVQGVDVIDGLNDLVNTYVFWPTNFRFTENQTVYVFDRSEWSANAGTYTKINSNPMAQWKINEIHSLENEGIAGLASGGNYSDNFVYESQDSSINPNDISSGIVLVPTTNIPGRGISKSNHTVAGNRLVRVDLKLGNFDNRGLRIDYAEAWGYRNPGGEDVLANPKLAIVKYGRSPNATAPDNTP